MLRRRVCVLLSLLLLMTTMMMTTLLLMLLRLGLCLECLYACWYLQPRLQDLLVLARLDGWVAGPLALARLLFLLRLPQLHLVFRPHLHPLRFPAVHLQRLP